MALVEAKNKRTGKVQTVPAHYVDNPRIFGGAFTAPDSDATATSAAVETPTPAPTPDQAPASGSKKNKE